MPWLLSKKRRQSPSSSPSGQPWAATSSSSASQLREQGLARLHHAAARGDLGWLRRWHWYVKVVGIDRPDQEMQTPLHLASANGHADVVRYLLRKNSQPNLADNFKRTALMKAVQQEQEECAAVLLEHGADPNLADADGNTALHLAVLSKNTAVAGLLLEHHAKSDAQNQWGFTPFQLAALQQHEEILECLVNKAADRSAQGQGESHEAHLEEDNLPLQEELDRADAELQEEEEKHLLSEHCVPDLKTALDAKKREAITSSQELQDLLEEDAQDFASENSRLEATVQQPSDGVEALPRALQASASVAELSQQLDREREQCTELEVKNQALQEELSTLRGKCENLTMDKCQLQEELVKLQHHLETNVVDRSQLEQCKREVEEQADQEIRQKLQEVNEFLQVQAAYQDTLEEIRTSHVDSLKKQLEDRIRDLERALGRRKSNQPERPFQKESTQAEVDKYKELYLVEAKTRKNLTKKLERANERLAEANTKLFLERHRSKSAVPSSAVSGHLVASPLLDSPGLGHLGISLGLSRSLGLRTAPRHLW
ncbi:ankyrin repeat domain-containing protein 26-like [Chiroxiphia lanceolata]|uniref:ankyrin repeat domain-containing protein 26-like n=1 Tax=Chiroxiphia lanceolata TaxID=296741 RepID=UPI0013CE73D0|nr:ankyrin repeat domain-containing protein 26-like [Chiroxiphia lanceolata]